MHMRRAGHVVARPLNCGVSRTQEVFVRTRSTAPTKVAIDHDDYHASHVGRLADGRQFFATTPFVPAVGGPGREFVAVYLFDPGGRFLEARIDDLGPRNAVDAERAAALFNQRVSELGQLTHGRIEVSPFEVNRHGAKFGLIPRPPEDPSEDDSWWVEVQPGNYMAFHEPWDSGEYDT